jgi:TolB protein
LGTLSGRLAFSDGDDVWTSKPDGSDRRRVTDTPGLDFDPSWSPDGRRIAFRTHRTGDEEIFVVRADGTGALNLSDSAGGDWSPAWSPDGELIAFSSDRAGLQAVWVRKPDGSGLRQLTTVEGEYPSWKSDASALVFASASRGLYDIWRVAADGSAAEDLIDSPGTYDFTPAWSPDGRYVAYDTQRDFAPREPGIGPEFEIHVLDLLTGEDRRLTVDRREDRFPCWSPDGRYLAWSREGTIVIARADGSGATEVTSGTFPDWWGPR